MLTYRKLGYALQNLYEMENIQMDEGLIPFLHQTQNLRYCYNFQENNLLLFYMIHHTQNIYHNPHHRPQWSILNIHDHLY